LDFTLANAGFSAINYRLKEEDISYIFQHSEVDVIIVDAELLSLLSSFHREKPLIPFIVDYDTDATDSSHGGPFDKAIKEGLELDQKSGGLGWAGLQAQTTDEDEVISLAYTSGTTAKPKGVEYTHRGVYLAAVANIIESGLNFEFGGQRAKYLWTLPMFHVSMKDSSGKQIANGN
jgi:long-subunit acyl-CoA synthetase (AMP-forming)